MVVLVVVYIQGSTDMITNNPSPTPPPPRHPSRMTNFSSLPDPSVLDAEPRCRVQNRSEHVQQGEGGRHIQIPTRQIGTRYFLVENSCFRFSASSEY